MILRIITVLFAIIFFCSCQRQPATSNQASPETTESQRPYDQPGKEKMEIKISSPAFQEGDTIPPTYTCDGSDVSPPLAWTNVPQSAKFLALICEDPDAPGKTWVHWLVYDLPPTTTQIAEDVPHTEKLASGGKQGTNDFKKIGYGGPCPPSGTHRYFFRLYALDKETGLEAGATKDQLLKAIEGHIVAEGELMGRYKR